MDENVNWLLHILDDEIDRKCFEIRQKRKTGLWEKFFIIGCALFVTVPMLLVFAGISLWTFCIPMMLFLMVSFSLLSPLLFSGKLGGLE